MPCKTKNSNKKVYRKRGFNYIVHGGKAWQQLGKFKKYKSQTKKQQKRYRKFDKKTYGGFKHRSFKRVFKTNKGYGIFQLSPKKQFQTPASYVKSKKRRRK